MSEEYWFIAIGHRHNPIKICRRFRFQTRGEGTFKKRIIHLCVTGVAGNDCERNREARKYGDSDGEILRWQTVAAVLKLSVRARALLPIPSPSPVSPFSPLLIFRAKVGNTGILIIARHRGNSVGPTNHGARPINSRPYCGRERDGCEAAATRSGNGRCVHRHSQLFLPSYKFLYLNLRSSVIVLLLHIALSLLTETKCVGFHMTDTSRFVSGICRIR